MTSAQQSPTALVASMRNEGIFILEWIAYHLEIGFDRVVVCSNNCTDGSDLLLDALDERGFVTHLRADPLFGESPQDAGMTAAMTHLDSTDTEWLCHLDSDEFLCVGQGDGRVDDLLGKAGQGDVIALTWRNFGDNGERAWRGDVLPIFTACEGQPRPETAKFKSMFRFRKFEHAYDHMPRDPKTRPIDVRSASGDVLLDHGFGSQRSRYHPLDMAIAPESACINHYAIKSSDVFEMKNDRGDGQGKITKKYRIGSKWHKRANRNDVENRDILRHWEKTRRRIEEMRANSEIAELEADCITWFKARRSAVLTPDNPDAWNNDNKGHED